MDNVDNSWTTASGQPSGVGELSAMMRDEGEGTNEKGGRSRERTNERRWGSREEGNHALVWLEACIYRLV
jgi:hypothetical protein